MSAGGEEDFRTALTDFDIASQALGAIDRMGVSSKRYADDAVNLSELARERYEAHKIAIATAAASDLRFRDAYKAFIDLADDAETLIQKDMQDGRNKLTTGRPAQYFVQRTTTPVLFVYPAPDTAQTYTFRYYAVRRIEDVGTYTNTADVVFRFLPCLVAGLSYYLALKKAPDRIQLLKTLYEEEFARAAIEDRDIASVYLTPDFGQ